MLKCNVNDSLEWCSCHDGCSDSHVAFRHYYSLPQGSRDQAKDAQDAEARIAKLPFAKYDGELEAVVPVYVGWLAKLYVFARNHVRL